MKQLTMLTLLFSLIFSGCTCGPEEPMNPTPDSGQIVMNPDSGVLPDAGENNCSFSAGDFLAAKTFTPTESGRLEITDAQGAFSVYNGYYIDVEAGTTDESTWFAMTAAIGVNLPNPETGRLVPQTHGLSVFAISENQPCLTNGDFNEVPLLKEVKVLFSGHRGQVLFHNSEMNRLENMNSDVTPLGTLGRTLHFSSFYLLTTTPTHTASAMHMGNGRVKVSFVATDEGSNIFYKLQSRVLKDGTPLVEAEEAEELFVEQLAPGVHELTTEIVDQYGETSTYPITVTIDPEDLCAGVTCNGNGTCNQESGEPICECNDGFTGMTCGECAEGFLDYPNCEPDLCFNVDCPDDGNLCNGGEACNPNSGECESMTPVVCNDDGDVCNGTESCNPATGMCESSSPLVCDDGNVCNGTESCDPANGCQTGTPLVCNDGLSCNGQETCDMALGCQPGAAVQCGSHGSCQEAMTAFCSCDTGYTGVACELCDMGYQDNDGNGICQPDCTLANLSCSGNGTCSDNTGIAECSCDPEYTGSDCSACASGYQDNDGNGTCTETCATSNLSCNSSGHGSCQDSSGIAQCICTDGWSGPNCTTPPPPTISNLRIDCSGSPVPGFCASGFSYPLNWNMTHATSYTTSLSIISGCTSTAGTVTPASGSMSGNSMSISYTLGNCSPSVVRITVNVSGPGGNASAFVDVTHY